MYFIDKIAETHISEAIERGDLDNLPGTGKPLELDDDSNVPEELRAGYRLLKNAGYIPLELELRKEIGSVEILLANTTNSFERTEISKRLVFLMNRLGISQGCISDLRFEQAYFEKLSNKL